MDSSATLKKLKEQAELAAMKKLQTMFNTSDQLEQIQQHKNRVDKRKNVVEAQLKSAIQSHFISVNSCMEQLQLINHNVDNIRTSIYSIEDEYRTISHLETTLHELRLEAHRHKQLKAALNNMDNILNVDVRAKIAEEYVDSEEFLKAHEYLIALEYCRNDILAEIDDSTEGATQDINLVKDFFKKVEESQKKMERAVVTEINRMLNTVRKLPQKLVTAVRIIEREEYFDEDWRRRSLETRFTPINRPRELRKQAFKEIEKCIDNRVHGSQTKEVGDQSWLSTHLGQISHFLVQDLEGVKKLCEPCFPPSYKLFDFYIKTTHKVLQQYLHDLIDTNRLKNEEVFVLISYQVTYRSKHFMGNPKLNIDTSKLEDLIDDKHYQYLVNKHIEYSGAHIPNWFDNALTKNVEIWSAKIENRHNFSYCSTFPNDLTGLLVETLRLTKEANDDRFSKAVLDHLLDQWNTFLVKYTDKITEFKTNYFKDTSKLLDIFTMRMIAIANDCLTFRSYVLNIRQDYDVTIDKDEVGGPNDRYQQIANKFYNKACLCVDYIIEDMTKCLEDSVFKILISQDWLAKDEISNTIIMTSADYYADLVNLGNDLCLVALYKWHNRIKVEYMKGLLQNMTGFVQIFAKRQCVDQNERSAYSNKLTREILQLEQWFKDMTKSTKNNEYIFDFNGLNAMNRILKTDDKDFLGVEIGALLKAIPELTSDMVYALLALRGDVSKSDYKEQYESYVIPTDKKQPLNTTAKAKPDEAIAILKRELKIV